MFKAVSGIGWRRLARRWLPLAAIPLVVALALAALALRAQPHPVAATVPVCSTPDATGASPCSSAGPSPTGSADTSPSDTPAASPTATADPTVTTTPQPTVQPTPTPFPSTGESAVLIPCGAAAGDRVGSSVAITPDGNEIVTGASAANNGDGVAYILTRVNGAWRQDARLTVSDAQYGGFGGAVAVSADGGTALVAAPGSGAGRVYVFSRTPLGWTQTAELKAPGAIANNTDLFGSAVSLSADGLTAAISRPGYFTHGTAYVFTRSGSTWSVAATLTAAVPHDSDSFGETLALDAAGKRLILGDPAQHSVEVYGVGGGQWTRTATLSDPQVPAMGNSVALSADGGTVIAGDSSFYGTTASVDVFVDTGGAWRAAGTIHKPGQPSGMYGTALALSASGSRALIGDVGGATPEGLAYLVDSAGGSWSTQQELKNPLPAPNDSYGLAVALDGDGAVAAVGANGLNNNTGAVVMFDGSTPNPPLTVHC